MKKFKIVRFVLFFVFLVPLFLPFAHAQFFTSVETKFNKSTCGASCSAARPAQQTNQSTPVNSQAHASGQGASGQGVRMVITEHTVNQAKYGEPAPAYQGVPMPQKSNNLSHDIIQAQQLAEGRVQITLIDIVSGDQTRLKGERPENVAGGPVVYKEAEYNKNINATRLVAEYKSMPNDVYSWAEENLKNFPHTSYDEASGGPGFTLDTKITELDPLTGLSPELAAGVKSLKPDTQLWGIVIKNEQGEPLAALTWFSDQNQYKVARYIDE
ncbi:MAG: hypothetical protein KKG91_03015, partial [Candidatus Omnitrophica bacterium]|nr:hypothetical protein [Candidatus Omnitrophota bacterium]